MGQMDLPDWPAIAATLCEWRFSSFAPWKGEGAGQPPRRGIFQCMPVSWGAVRHPAC
jgi:hypothetical protein